MVYVKKSGMVGVKIGARLRMEARGTEAFFAHGLVFATKRIHVSTRSAEVGDITLEIGHPSHLPDLTQNGILGPGSNKLALMSRDGTESTSAEASSVHTNRMANHLISGDSLALVTRMRQASVREIKRGINLLGGHGRMHGIDAHGHIAVTLPDSGTVHTVALLLNVLEILSLTTLGPQAVLKTMQHNLSVAIGSLRYVVKRLQRDALQRIGQILYRFTGIQTACNLQHRQLTHSVHEKMSLGIHKQ